MNELFGVNATQEGFFSHSFSLGLLFSSERGGSSFTVHGLVVEKVLLGFDPWPAGYMWLKR